MELQVVEHRLSEGSAATLPPGPRVLYRLDDNAAQFSAGPVELAAPLHALAFELVPSRSDGPLLSAALALERRRAAASPALSGTVRVSVGEWGGGFLARHLDPSGETGLPPT